MGIQGGDTVKKLYKIVYKLKGYKNLTFTINGDILIVKQMFYKKKYNVQKLPKQLLEEKIKKDFYFDKVDMMMVRAFIDELYKKDVVL